MYGAHVNINGLALTQGSHVYALYLPIRSTRGAVAEVITVTHGLEIAMQRQ